jgi:hypothetical protein
MNFNPANELDNQKALELIRKIIKSKSGQIIFSLHAKERMRERSYTTDDVLHILLKGDIASKEFHNPTQVWRYKIQSEDLAGEEGAVVTAIINSASLVVITVLS